MLLLAMAPCGVALGGNPLELTAELSRPARDMELDERAGEVTPLMVDAGPEEPAKVGVSRSRNDCGRRGPKRELQSMLVFCRA